MDDFKTNLEKVLETISSERDRATLVGDLNVDMKGKRLTPQARSLNQLFNFVVVKPTRTGADPNNRAYILLNRSGLHLIGGENRR